MKNEVIVIRVDEKTKLKLLQKSQYYNTNLSRFMLDTVGKACNLDVIQLWVYAYIDFTIKRNRADNGCVITHWKDENGEYWNVPPLKNGYYNKIDLLEALDETTDYELPKMYEVLDNWGEFVRRLTLLGMWEERNE